MTKINAIIGTSETNMKDPKFIHSLHTINNLFNLPSMFIKSNNTTGKIGVLYLSKIVLNSALSLSLPLWKKEVYK